MDERSYSYLLQATANQPLGGKEIRFPANGLSDTIESSHQSSQFSPACFNVMLRSPSNEDWCGGTRPGLKPFSGAQPAAPQLSVSRWLWPNGDPILWPNGVDTVAFGEMGDSYLMPDGGVLFMPHQSFSVKAEKGAVPETCSAFAWYRDRFVVAAGSMWYASRIGEHRDFDYGGDSGDPSRPAAGNIALAGRKGEQVTALAAISDAALVVATKRSLWRVIGDPTQAMACVSDNIGIISRDAWCWDGIRFWFMGPNGLYAMAMGELPMLMTPHLKDAVSGWDSAVLVYDPERIGIHILGIEKGVAAAKSAYYDIANKAYWPMKYPSLIRPAAGGVAMLDGKNRVMFLCADGVFRYWDESQATDDGSAIASALAMGPVTHTTGDTENAFLAEVDFEFGKVTTATSGVFVSGAVGNTSMFALDNAKAIVGWVDSGTGDAAAAETFRYGAIGGWNRVRRPRVRCNSFSPVVWSKAEKWSISKVTAVHRGCGRIRR